MDITEKRRSPFRLSRRHLFLAGGLGLGSYAAASRLSFMLDPSPPKDAPLDEAFSRLSERNRPKLLKDDPASLLQAHAGERPPIGKAPRIGAVEYGGYMEEAFRAIGISGASRSHFHQVHSGRQGFSLGLLEHPPGSRNLEVCRYGLYRQQVASTYGIPLADANYMSFYGGTEARQMLGRAFELGLWITEAAAYGEPTVGLQLTYLTDKTRLPWHVFKQEAGQTLHPELAAFREMALALQRLGISFRVRFLSEADLRGSPYSCVDEPARFRESLRFFRRHMPENVRIVFSPSCASSPWILDRLLGSDPLPINMIGGTLYRSIDRPLQETYSRFHEYCRNRFGATRLQICELGAPLSRQKETLEFLAAAESGRFPGLEHVNLFGAKLNASSAGQKAMGSYGFLAEGAKRSYLFDHLSKAVLS
jgi:hypothetical protein